MKAIQSLKAKPKDQNKMNSVYFADFETVSYKGKQFVSCYSIVSSDGLKILYQVIEYDENNLQDKSYELVKEFIDIIMDISKDKMVYFHNFVKFDMYFILEVLTKDYSHINVDLMSRDKIIYSITLENKNNGAKTQIKDTFLMLSMSLLKLSIFYGVKKKEDFNHDNVYKDYDNSDFKDRIIRYCISDSKCLRNIFIKFRDEIYDLFGVDCLHSLTMSSLSLKIYRTRYYDSKIQQICIPNESKDRFVRNGYYGGVVELYKPHLINGWHYDVNALYPSVMKDNYYPTGEGTYIDKNLLKDICIDSFFGFLEVEVISTNAYMPFLVKQDPIKGLVSPIGTWVGVYFSEEIRYAMKFGYKFKILKALKYDKSILFNDFVSDMYKYRLKYGKNSSLGISVKLLMNSLYGRFGMKLESTKTELVTYEAYKSLLCIYDIPQPVEINNRYFINYKSTPNLVKVRDCYLDGVITKKEFDHYKNAVINNSVSVNSSVCIAAAVTAYARILMYDYKLKCEGEIYYTDTDSIFSSVEMPAECVSDSGLGKLKLEGLIEEAYFIAPKSYIVKYLDQVVMKSKGFSSKLVDMEDYINVYGGEEKNIYYKNYFYINKSSLIIEERGKKYTFRSNMNKRSKVFDINIKWVDSAPLIYYSKDV